MDSIIFDIDGTIWNSTDVVAMAWNKALEKENLDVRVTADQLKGLFGRLLPDIAKAILPEQTEAEQLRVIDICCQAEHDLLRAMGAPVYDGLKAGALSCTTSFCNVFTRLKSVVHFENGLENLTCRQIHPGDSGEAKAANIRSIAKEIIS